MRYIVYFAKSKADAEDQNEDGQEYMTYTESALSAEFGYRNVQLLLIGGIVWMNGFYYWIEEAG